ncbi:MAG: MFS transporter [archaeon]|nr:MFS transporter [archaeon]
MTIEKENIDDYAIKKEKYRQEHWKKKYMYSISAFYLFQGFYAMSLGAYQRSMMGANNWNLDFGLIAIMNAVLVIPNYLKMFTGLLSDYLPIGKWGRRRPYIFIGAILYIPCFIGLTMITDVEYIGIWIFLIILIQWVWVLVDGTLDALSVDITPIERMGRVQGSNWAAYGLGALVGTLIYGIIAQFVNIPTAIAIVGFFAVFQGISGLMVKEPPVDKGDLPTKADIVQEFSKKEVWIGLLFTFIMNATFGLYPFFQIYLENYIQLDTLTAMIGVGFAMIGFFIGSIAGGKYIDKIGAKKAVLPAVVLFWLGIIPWWFLNSESPFIVIAIVAIICGFVLGTAMVPGNRIAMELANPKMGGFMFATFASASNAGQAILGSLMIGTFEGIVGMPAAVLTLIPFTVAGIFILPFVKPWEPVKTD